MGHNYLVKTDSLKEATNWLKKEGWRLATAWFFKKGDLLPTTTLPRPWRGLSGHKPTTGEPGANGAKVDSRQHLWRCAEAGEPKGMKNGFRKCAKIEREIFGRGRCETSFKGFGGREELESEVKRFFLVSWLDLEEMWDGETCKKELIKSFHLQKKQFLHHLPKSGTFGGESWRCVASPHSCLWEVLFSFVWAPKGWPDKTLRKTVKKPPAEEGGKTLRWKTLVILVWFCVEELWL